MSYLGVAVVEGTAREREDWDFAFRHFCVQHVFVLGVEWAPYRQDYTRVLTLATLDVPSGTKLVVVAPTNGVYVQGTESLTTFAHPEEALYVFGQDHDHFDPVLLGGRTPVHLVHVPVQTDLQMHSYAAGMLVLYDRMVKCGG